MNYWPAEICNLSECHKPLFALIRELCETGAATAESVYGARGAAAHHNTDLWRLSSPTVSRGNTRFGGVGVLADGRLVGFPPT